MNLKNTGKCEATTKMIISFKEFRIALWHVSISMSSVDEETIQNNRNHINNMYCTSGGIPYNKHVSGTGHLPVDRTPVEGEHH